MAVQLGIDPKKSDQVVRGAVVMPNGTGKTKRVAVFAQGAKAEEAKAAGADIVGMDDLAARVKAGDMPFDVVIAAPDAMRVVGTLGQILGPRGLMPNPKVGTVTPDVATAVKNAKAGQVQFRADKAGIIHATLGRRSFDSDKLQGNLVALIDALTKAKPATSKGVYLRKVAVSSTMGLGVRVDIQTLATGTAARRKQRNRPRPDRERPVWWAAGSVQTIRRAIQDRWRGSDALNRGKEGRRSGPTQMAIPPTKRSRDFRRQLVAVTRARRRGNPEAHLKE